MTNPNSPFGPPPQAGPPQQYGPGPQPGNPYAQPPMGHQPPPQPGMHNPYAPPTNDQFIGVMPQYDEMILAGRGERLMGAIVDTLLTLAAAVPGIILMVMEIEEAGIGALVLGILAITIYQWYLISTTGQSLAKKWLGMRIVKVDGTPVNFVSGVILRVWVVAALGAIPFVGNFVGLIDACMIFGEERRCLHDHIAGTKVISA